MAYTNWTMGELVSEYAMVSVELAAYERLNVEVPSILLDKKGTLEDAVELKKIENRKLEIRRLQRTIEALKTKEEQREEAEARLAELLAEGE